MTTKRVKYIFIITVLLSLLLVACGGKEEAALMVSDGAQAGDLIFLKPIRYSV